MRNLVTKRVATWCFLALAVPAVVAAAPAADAPGSLTLDAAVRLALENNRSLETARLQVEKATEELLADKTRRLPSFKSTVSASQLLTPVTFSFPEGAFGTFPGTGPIPSKDTNISTPRRINVFVNSQVSQPLTQLFRINLGIANAAVTRDVNREQLRDQELALANSVKRVYFGILQAQSALNASDEAIALYRELDRTLTVRVAQKVSLRSDALDVQTRLAQEELTRLTTADTLASQKEQLNQLLGRDIRTEFEVEPVTEASSFEVDLAAAERRALDERPDVKQARLKVAQADLDRRAKRTERIPDVGLVASYVSNFNMDVMPQNMAMAGVQVSWEPFDWGRKGRELAAKSQVVNQARLALHETEDRVILDVNARFRKLQENRALLKVAAMAQASAREKVRVKSNQFQAESALIADVLHARADLATSNDQYQQALLAFWTAKADFERAVGEDVIR
jgi:outer membrane protein TolC